MLKLLQKIWSYLTGNLTTKLDEMLLAQKLIQARLDKIELAINGEPIDLEPIVAELKETNDDLSAALAAYPM